MPRMISGMHQALVRRVAIVLFALLSSQAHVTKAAGGSFEKIEASFELPQVHGNPFDYLSNDVEVTLTAPEAREIKLPAFFDGGQTWRVRHTPDSAGKYSITSVTLNGADANAQQLSPKSFVVAGSLAPGFVRIDPNDKMRFVFDNGAVYYPVGYDLAWHQNGSSPMPPLTESLARMGKAGVNWTRIWMNHWDGKNLDWSPNHRDQPPLGQLDLSVARTWDTIVDAAHENGVSFQMTLQHHGQYTTHADTNWAINPWNKANGGCLENPTEFFTDPKAIALTKAKYRYIIARWGYSPAIMAWELFNEVESVDAFHSDPDSVSVWHREMAKFIRQYDSYHHLITTSSRVDEPGLWLSTDYYQSHSYPSDILSAIANLDDANLPKPYFLGEFGGPNSNAEADAAEVIHRGLWGSLMSQSSGAAQYWFWYEVEPKNLLFHYTSAQKFIALSGFPGKEHFKPIPVEVETDRRGPLQFGPGLDWAKSRQTRFTISPAGTLEGISGMSAFLQGRSSNHAMFPSATFDVDYPSAGTFAVHADQITARGAQLELSVDGQPPSSVVLGAAAADDGQPGTRNMRHNGNIQIDTTLSIPVSAGKHTIHMENIGQDWIHIRNVELSPYAPTLGVLAKGNGESAVLWIYRRNKADATPTSGKLAIPGLIAGSYRIVWWDTYKGEIVKDENADLSDAGSLNISTPAIARDIAVFIDSRNQKHLTPVSSQ